MPGPNLTFAFIIATLFGAVFHLVVGGDAGKLVLYLITGWIGFLLGQMAGDTFGFTLLAIGRLNIVAAAAGAIFALLSVYILSKRRT
ncbi:MAG: hypothetical protein ACPG7F_17590 [Aggregatilineales bacterium]